MAKSELNQYMNSIKKFIQGKLKEEFSTDVDISEIRLEKTPNLEMGEFAFACFPYSRILKKKPFEIANLLAQEKCNHPAIKSMHAAGAYLNIKIQRQTLAKAVCDTVLQQKEKFGSNQIGEGKTLMIEYSSPNTNKPLHIGHVRNNLIGMALSNIMSCSGFKVIKANLINDRGIHICKSMLAYQKWGEGVTPKTAQKKGDHFVGDFYVRFDVELKKERLEYAKEKGIDLEEFGKEALKDLKNKARKCKDKEEKKKIRKDLSLLNKKAQDFEQDFLDNSKLHQEAKEMLRKWEQGDKEVRALWKKMNDWVYKGFHVTYEQLGCKFDKMYYESDTYTLGRKHVEKGLEDGIFTKKEDGSVWVKADDLRRANPKGFKGLEIKDKLLLRADGTTVYMTQDIGTAVLKKEDFDLDTSIYVVADEQNLHFKILFAILKMLGFSWAENCHHAAYGMVTLPKGMGKIKSREGTAVDADDMMEEMVQRAKEAMQEGNLRVPEDKIEQTAWDIALGALKIFLLHVTSEKNIQFDPNETIDFSGDTGPAIQYSHARICSILRNAEEKHDIDMDKITDFDYKLLDSLEEFEIIRQLSEFPETIQNAAETYNISSIANYLLTLTKAFAKSYAKHRVLGAETEEHTKARLRLCQAIAQTIKNGMALLGANVPESM